MESALFSIGLFGFVFVCYLSIKKDSNDSKKDDGS